MIKLVSIQNIMLASLADRPADNQAPQFTLFLFETLVYI